MRPRAFKRAVMLFVITAAIPLVVYATAVQLPRGEPSPIQPPGKVHRLAIEDAASGNGSFVVLLNGADLSGEVALAESNAVSWQELGRMVNVKLNSHAEETQKEIVAKLQSKGTRFKRYTVANAIIVKGGDLGLLRELEAMPSVIAIEPNRAFPALHPAPPQTATSGPGPEGHSVTWGIANMRAHDVWHQGFTGQGMVIANADTGVRWDHVSLVSNYRGTTANQKVDHNYNWWDAIEDYHYPPPPTNVCGFRNSEPCVDTAGMDARGRGTVPVVVTGL